LWIEDVEVMKKFLLLMISLLIVLMPASVSAEEIPEENKEIIIYLFRGKTCAHCEAALTYMSEHRDKIPDYVKIVTYEVWENTINGELQKKVEEVINVPEDKRENTPLFIIGNEYVSGYGTSTFNNLMNIAAKYYNGEEEYVDVVANTLSETNLKVSSMTLDDLYPEANPVVTAIIFGIFGVIVVGFLGMILFSRKR